MAANYGRIRRMRWRFTVDPQLVNERVFPRFRPVEESRKNGSGYDICNPFARRLRATRAISLSLSLSSLLLLAVIKNPRVTFYRCSTVVSLLVSCGSVSWISCLVAFRNSATGTPPRVWGTGLAGGDGVSRPESV